MELLQTARTYIKQQSGLVDGRLKLYQYEIIGLEFLLCVAIIFGAAQHRHEVQTIGINSEPSVETGKNIEAQFRTIDADAANVSMAKPGADMNSLNEIEVTEDALSRELVKASHLITYPGEEEEIETLNWCAFRMEQLLGATFVYVDKGDPARIAAYRDELDLLNSTSIPAAKKLEEINERELVSGYNRQNIESWITLAVVLVLGFWLLKSLRDTERYIHVTYRIRKNKLLRAAAALGTLAMLYTATVFLLEWHWISRVAYNDAYLSMSPLQTMGADFVELNAAESRFLADPAHKSDHEQAYRDALKGSVIFEGGKTFESIAAELRRAIAEGKQKSFKVTGVKGLLGQELDNITFDGEMEAALAVLEALAVYDQIDQMIRDRVRQGKYDAAVALCIGQNEGESNWAFARLVGANHKLIDINETQFKGAIKLGFAALTGFYIGGVLLFIALGSLTISALKPLIGILDFIRN